MMLGLATPTEAGAMGAVGAIVLAVLHHPELSRAGRRIFVGGVIAAAIGGALAIAGDRAPGLQARLCRDLFRDSVALPRGGSHPGPARPDQAGLRDDHADHRDGRFHPDRVDLLFRRVSRRSTATSGWRIC